MEEMKKIVLAVLVILVVFVWIGISKSMTSYKIQCALGDKVACHNTGIMYETGKDVGGNIINNLTFAPKSKHFLRNILQHSDDTH